MDITTRTTNLLQTKEFAQSFAASLKGGEVIVLSGQLGGGKTTFVQFVAAALGVRDLVQSPTFVYWKPYHGKRLNLIHADLYRVQSEAQLRDLGLDDWIGRPDSVLLIEWGEKFPHFWPATTKQLHFEVSGATGRIIEEGKLK